MVGLEVRWLRRLMAVVGIFSSLLAAAQRPPTSWQMLHQFAGPPTDGANPYGAVAFGANGVLYGVTQAGGNFQQNGTVFSLTPPRAPGGAWKENILWVPLFVQGVNLYSTLVVGSDGTLYGTSFGGASGDNGTAFALHPPTSSSGRWTPQILYRFGGIPDAGSPTSGLTPGANNIFYGTASEGGGYNAGAVYSIQLPSTGGGKVVETLLYSFRGGNDGGNPFGPVVVGPGGVLYGTARFGGASNSGCVFQLTPPANGGAWAEQVIHNFSGSPEGFPIGGVVLASNGVLYGATLGIPESDSDFGNVYQLAPLAGGRWTYSNLHSFTNKRADAANPVGIIVGPGGVLYGSAYAGAATVFQLSPPAPGGLAWTETLLGQFGNSYAPPVIGPDGALYGTSFGKFGSASEAGSVFRLVP